MGPKGAIIGVFALLKDGRFAGSQTWHVTVNDQGEAQFTLMSSGEPTASLTFGRQVSDAIRELRERPAS